MLQQGVIQPSRSPWNSPLFLFPKKDGQFRPVMDLRKVSEVTEDDRYPLPVLSVFVMSLGHRHKIFNKFDLLSGYWQVPMAPESKKITAFGTPNGHYGWLRIPFGLKRVINTIYSDMLGTGVCAYLDDFVGLWQRRRNPSGKLRGRSPKTERYLSQAQTF